MKLLYDYLPILLFFIAYKLAGIFAATAVAIVASIGQTAIHWLRFHYLEKTHVISFFLVTLLGSATLFLHNPVYIKWKPTLIYWAFSTGFACTRWVGKKTLIQRLIDDKIQLPLPIWYRLNTSWSLFFLLMGSLNVYVIYHFSTNAWVNFKLFGTLGLTLTFIVLQGWYVSRHAKASLFAEDSSHSI